MDFNLAGQHIFNHLIIFGYIVTILVVLRDTLKCILKHDYRGIVKSIVRGLIFCLVLYFLPIIFNIVETNFKYDSVNYNQ